MSHKQECICYCIDLLTSRNLAHIYNKHLFEHYYRKNHCCSGNAYTVGLNAMDFLINNFEPKQMEVSNDGRNQSEAGDTQRA